MSNTLLAIMTAMTMVSTLVFAEPPTDHKSSVGTKGATSSLPSVAQDDDEKIEALKLKGDVKNGKDVFEVCGACHLPSGAGRTDGTFPQLAGQHASVIIKQIADIRDGSRSNPTMYPFAITLSNAQELADVAAYIQTLCVPREHGMGYKDPAILSRGEELYKKSCANCHGANGEGDAKKLYPSVAGQHYLYLLRQATELRDGKRRNGNPQMIKAIKKYNDRDLSAVASYMATLAVSGNLCPEPVVVPVVKAVSKKK